MPITIKKKNTTTDNKKKANLYLSPGLFSKLPANVCWGWMTFLVVYQTFMNQIPPTTCKWFQTPEEQ